MKMKQKLRVALGLLFLGVVFFGFLSLLFLRQMSRGTEVILENNYATLKYVREMREILDINPLPLNENAIKSFDRILKNEEANVTEPGEKDAVISLRRSLESLKNPNLSLSEQSKIQKVIFEDLRTIVDVNLKAVESKSLKAENAVRNATVYIGFLAAFTFLLIFSLIFNLIGFFEEPFNQITDGLRNVARGRFASFIHYNKNDEMGALYAAFNEMTVYLDRFQKEAEERAMVEQLKAEAVIRHTDNPIIILNDKQVVSAINPAAEKAFNVKPEAIVGKNTSTVPDIDKLIKQIVKDTPNGKTIDLNDSEFRFCKEVIIVPTVHISSLQEFEIAVSGKFEKEVIIFKRK